MKYLNQINWYIFHFLKDIHLHNLINRLDYRLALPLNNYEVDVQWLFDVISPFEDYVFWNIVPMVDN
jgi:hypothetical protein